MRDVALGAIVLGLLYVPFLDHGRIPIGSLGTTCRDSALMIRVATLEARDGLRQRCWLGMAVSSAFLTAIWMRRKSTEAGLWTRLSCQWQHRLLFAYRSYIQCTCCAAAVHEVDLNRVPLMIWT